MKTTTHMPLWILLKINYIKCNLTVQHVFTWYACFSTVVFHIIGIYQISIACISGMLQIDIKVSVVYLIMGITIFAFWYSLLKEKKKLRCLINLMNSQQDLLISNNNGNQTTLKCAFVSIFVLPFLLGYLFAFSFNENQGIAEYWTYGVSVPNKRLRLTIRVFFSYIYFVFNMEYPCLIIFSMCLLMVRCGSYLELYYKRFQSLNINVKTASDLDIMKGYFCMIKIVQTLRDTLSIPLFAALTISLLNLYVTLSTSLLLKTISFSYILELTCSGSTGIVTLFSITLCGARIPEFMSKIKEKVGNLLNENTKYKKDTEFMYLLCRIGKSDVIQLSACGIVKLQRSFLISAIAGLLTYGLLILNFKKRDFV